jgi:hypothetical protein
MAENNVRQSSLILGGGPGALTVLRDGSTALIPGIDAWYITPKRRKVGETQKQRIPSDVILRDPLLATNLGVDHFVLPPAEGVSEEEDSDYLDLTLFPTWTVCYSSSCNRMRQNDGPRPNDCANCIAQGKKGRRMVQTNFVIACEDGHLDEFPWVEWVHKGIPGSCGNPKNLAFKANGVVELRSQKIECLSCGAFRNLSGTNIANPDGTTELSTSLQRGEVFLCKGNMPWLGSSQKTGCTRHVRMVLRSSNNIYFATTVSSILVPENTGGASKAVERLLRDPKKGKIQAWLDTPPRNNYPLVANLMLLNDPNYYEGFTLEEITQGLQEAFTRTAPSTISSTDEVVPFDRTPEWKALISAKEERDLVVRPVSGYKDNGLGLSAVNAVPLLRKTTALRGFSRLFSKDVTASMGRQLLRRDPIRTWLPAIQQTGEGILITLDSEKVKTWAAQPGVEQRIKLIQHTLRKNSRTIVGGEPEATFVMLHTFAHVLIQELVIECGYTAAALAERIYATEGKSSILIYTASASADGTMGGLVEMSAPQNLMKAISNAITNARWCSNDPVCMGDTAQGNSGSNLAACHNCCLLPETACEHFNGGLDRGMLIGDSAGTQNFLGYFDFIAR